MALVFIIPATGLSVSNHLCIDCQEAKLSIFYHHQDYSCLHDHSEKDWHCHFFEKHEHHNKKCQYDQIIFKTPFLEPEFNNDLFPVEYYGFLIQSEPINQNRDYLNSNLAINHILKIPEVDFSSLFCVFLI